MSFAFFRICAFVLSWLALTACSSPNLIPVPPSHPASSQAAVAPPATISDTLLFERTATSTHTPATAPKGLVLYRCPMDHEVTSAIPGVCPKCGMTLVPEAGK